IGHQLAALPIPEGNDQLGKELWAVPVRLPAAVLQVTAIPTVAEQSSQYVVAATQERRDIIDLILDPLGIIRPARSKPVLAHAGTIQPTFIQSQRGHIQARPSNIR